MALYNIDDDNVKNINIIMYKKFCVATYTSLFKKREIIFEIMCFQFPFKNVNG